MPARTLLAAAIVSGLVSLPGHAQTAPASPRFYVGLGANMLSNVPFKDQGMVPRLVGPALTAGMQFTPRLAGQIGVSYQWKKDTYPANFLDLTGYFVNSVTYRYSYLIVPVLLRFTVTAPAERFHLDLLGGGTLLHARSYSTYAYSASGVGPAEQSVNSDTRYNLTLGPSVRAALSPRLELTASGLVSARLGENYYRFSDRLFLNTSLGINYTFGQR
ncbi:MAG: hypothetical protein EOO62_13955 [Hymenobacter sp.]|nr:MAG: hypothetical protein EOO62_13955 [Hymenobacter sp.]